MGGCSGAGAGHASTIPQACVTHTSRMPTACFVILCISGIGIGEGEGHASGMLVGCHRDALHHHLHLHLNIHRHKIGMG